eukprot:4530419-Amphidinium_carterae.1
MARSWFSFSIVVNLPRCFVWNLHRIASWSHAGPANPKKQHFYAANKTSYDRKFAIRTKLILARRSKPTGTKG